MDSRGHYEPATKRRKISSSTSADVEPSPAEAFLSDYVISSFPMTIHPILAQYNNAAMKNDTSAHRSDRGKRAMKFSDSLGDFDNDDDNAEALSTPSTSNSSDPSYALLVDWNGRKLDRFDIRTLLDVASLPMQRVGTDARISLEEQDDEDFAELDRYLDLYTSDDQQRKDKEEEDKRLKMTQKGGFNAISFTYKDSVAPESKQAPEITADGSFRPPFDIPRGMKTPEDEKRHQIVDRTASFVRSSAQPSEALNKIRATQESNPNFSFLKSDDPLNPYFEFLLKSEQMRQQAIILSKLEAPKTLHADFSVPVVANPTKPSIIPNQAIQNTIHRFVLDYMAVYGGDSFINAVRSFVMTQLKPRLREKYSFLKSSNENYAYLRYYAFEEKGILIAEKDPEQLQRDLALQDAEKKKAERRAKAKMFLAQQQSEQKLQEDETKTDSADPSVTV